jgi:hypothetical protein
MRRKVLGGLVAALAAAIALQTAAQAQPRDSGLRECFGDVITQEEAEMSCVKFEGGEWTPVSRPDGVSNMFGTFVFFGILLSLVPAAAGAMLAKDAGLSPGAGFGIGLFGSWLGVIGMYLYGHSQRRGTSVVQIGSTATAPGAGPAVGAESETAAEPQAAAERLRTLKDLLDQGLITQAEYDERRRAAVESL